MPGFRKTGGRSKGVIRLSVIGIIMTMLVISGNLHASLYAESSLCNNNMGKVLDVVDDEVFTITVCDEVKVFKEFSYCYGVEEGDAVIFDGFTANCELVGFTVVRNGVQCGVLCP